MKVRAGKPLKLFHQVPDGDVTKVVKAILTNDLGNALPESPVTLTHLTNGAHFDGSSAVMPAVQLGTAVTYETFLADTTTPSGDVSEGEFIEREIISALGKTIVGVVDSGQAAIHSEKFTIIRGQDALIPLKFLIEELGDAFPLDDADSITFTFRKSDGSSLILTTAFSLGVAEETDITTRADLSSNLGGKFFLLDTPANSYYVWFNIASGFADPGVAGRTGVEVTLAENDDADTVAAALQTELDGLADVDASVASSVVTSTNGTIGAVTDITDGASPTLFTFTSTTQGVDPFTATVEVDLLREGVANGIMSEANSNSLRLGFDQDVRAMIVKGTETTIVKLNNVFRVTD